MNLLKNVKVSTIYSTTSGILGTTGTAADLSTAGSSGDGTTTKGGFPFASTGLDMSNFEGVMFIATVSGTTLFTLKASGGNISSTAASTTYTDIPKAYIQSASVSTAYDTVVLDLVNPVYRFVTVTAQLPNTSQTLTGITAIQYGAFKSPQTSLSTAYLVSGAHTVIGTTAAYPA